MAMYLHVGNLAIGIAQNRAKLVGCKSIRGKHVGGETAKKLDKIEK